MIDRDLAELYEVSTKRLNEQIKRNPKRFPEDLMFRLTQEEMDELVANCDRFSSLKHSSVPSHVFTEPGVAMLSTVLNSEQIRLSVQNRIRSDQKIAGQPGRKAEGQNRVSH